MSSKVSNSHLIEKIAFDSGISKKEASQVVKAFTTAITQALKKDERVALVGFGSFSVVKRKARAGKNPKTGEKIMIKAKNAPKFTAGNALKEALN